MTVLRNSLRNISKHSVFFSCCYVVYRETDRWIVTRPYLFFLFTVIFLCLCAGDNLRIHTWSPSCPLVIVYKIQLTVYTDSSLTDDVVLFNLIFFPVIFVCFSLLKDTIIEMRTKQPQLLARLDCQHVLFRRYFISITTRDTWQLAVFTRSSRLFFLEVYEKQFL